MAKKMHPNSLKNLEKGFFQPGNKLGGRPKGALSYKERFEKFLQVNRPLKLPDGTVEDREVLDGIIWSALAKATQGDVKAMEFVFNRAFGKETEKVELTGKDGQPLAIEHSVGLQEAERRLAEVIGRRQELVVEALPED